MNVIRYDLEPGAEHGRPLDHIDSRFWYFTDAYPSVTPTGADAEVRAEGQMASPDLVDL